MLRNFLYLNETQLDSYLGVLEGGLSDETVRRTRESRKRGLSGKVGAGGVSAGGERGGDESTEDERRLVDSPEQRFDRLIRALEKDPERWAYEQVLDLSDAWDRLSVGAVISVDCDAEIPTAVRLLSGGEELTGLADMLDVMRPFASVLGKDPDSLPDAEQTAAVRSFAQVASRDLVVVAEVDPEAPIVAGKLHKQFVREWPEGEVRIVGKVARRWEAGEKHSVLALPGASLLSRKQRRLQPTATDVGDDTVLEGPALTLDVLAIFR